ncbi:HEAT repeat domain-containing protein [Chloroflexota bacterium]
MDDPITTSEQLRNSKTDAEVKHLLNTFKQLPATKKHAAEPQLIQILKNGEVENLTRSWIPEFLGLVGTPTARKALMEQLPIEEVRTVRRWIATSLVRHFGGDDIITLVIQEFEQEQGQGFVTMLAESRSYKAIPKLIDLLKDYDDEIRSKAAWGLGQAQTKDAVDPLLQQLAEEKSPLVSQTIIEALVAIDDQRAVPALRKSLQEINQPPQLQITVLQALGHLAADDDKKVIQVLIEITCHSDRIVALTATDTLIKMLPQAEAAQHLAEFGLQQNDPKKLSRIADALRLVGGTDAINYLQTIKGDTSQERHAQVLLEQIGGSQAINVLVDRRMNALKQAGGRVEEFDTQALTIFNQTIGEAKRGFIISLLMSGTIFLIGVVLLGISIYLILQPESTLPQRLFGVGGSLAGLGSILAMFYRGPLERIERSVANLVQTEIAFLGYIRQVTQITAIIHYSLFIVHFN